MIHPTWFFFAAILSFIIFLNEIAGRSLSGVIGWFCAMSCFVALGCSAITGGYKGGQVDALSGKVYYELVTNDTSEVSWERINP